MPSASRTTRHGSERVDYPGLAAEVCGRVLADRQTGAADVFGLLVCGTGQGVAMAVNKLPGIRAGVVSDRGGGVTFVHGCDLS